MLALAGLALAGAAAAGLARRWAPSAEPLDRWGTVAVLLPVLGVATVRVLGGIGALSPWELLSAFALEAALAGWSPRRAPAHPPPASAGQLSLAALPPLLVAAAALSLALVAARVLPIFQWDSLGYHLPFVASALQAGSLAGVPWDRPYLGSYPHAVELWDLGARALLSDDRWLDAAELPLDLGAALAIAGLARRAGVSFGLAVGFGALFLCLPAAFLQLPSAYVDVPAAGFLLLAALWLLAPLSLRASVLFGLALGLLLGTKPTAPAPVALLGLAFLWRCAKAGRARLAVLPALLALGLGAESYAASFWRHGNPIWPIALSLGPLHFPGLHSVAELLASGAAAPHSTGPLPWRLLRAWTALAPWPIFDMRIGGFGPVFTCLALPLGLIGFARRRGLWLAAGLASLASADPAIARYTLAFPGLCLALSAAELSQLGQRSQRIGATIAAGLAATGLWLALPGLTAGAGPLRSMLRLPRQEREAALLPPANAPQWAAFRARLAPGAVVAADDSLDLTYLLWRSDLANRVLRTPVALEGDALLGWIDHNHVAAIVGGETLATGQLAKAHPERLKLLFACGASEPSCRVYEVEP